MHLHKTRIQIEKFLYKKGRNVALYNAEKSDRYITFEKSVKAGLLDQIKNVADYQTSLPLLMSLAKGPSQELLSQVSILISKDSLGKKIDLSAYMVWAGDQGGQAFLDKNNIDATFGLKDEELITYFNDYSRLVIDSVDDYTKEWIATKIQDGKIAGLTPFEMQQQLELDGEAISSIRAERIVLTETATAMTKIELEAAKRNGITETIWRTSLDERVCPICSPLEGEKRKIGDNFSSGTGGPPAHVSCRCYIEDVIPEGWIVPEKAWLG